MQNHSISALHLQQWHALRTLLHFLPSPYTQTKNEPAASHKKHQAPEHNEPACLTRSYTLYLTGTCAHTSTHIFDLTHCSHPHDKRNLPSSRQKPPSNNTSALPPRSILGFMPLKTWNPHYKQPLSKIFHWKSARGSTTTSRYHSIISLSNQLLQMYGLHYIYPLQSEQRDSRQTSHNPPVQTWRDWQFWNFPIVPLNPIHLAICVQRSTVWTLISSHKELERKWKRLKIKLNRSCHDTFPLYIYTFIFSI